MGYIQRSEVIMNALPAFRRTLKVDNIGVDFYHS